MTEITWKEFQDRRRDPDYMRRHHFFMLKDRVAFIVTKRGLETWLMHLKRARLRFVAVKGTGERYLIVNAWRFHALCGWNGQRFTWWRIS